MPNPTSFKSHEEYLSWYRSYRAQNITKIREYKRQYNKAWRKKYGYKANKRYKRRWPEKIAAHDKLQYAVKRGYIVRGCCQVCNKPNAQGHHDDYSKPLDVKWFCPLHHKHYELKLITVDK